MDSRKEQGAFYTSNALCSTKTFGCLTGQENLSDGEDEEIEDDEETDAVVRGIDVEEELNNADYND